MLHKSKTCKNPNPQGKGLVPIMDELACRRLVATEPPTAAENSLVRTYALSRLILCAEFHFKPVCHTDYYLYEKNHSLKLSMISPKQWGDTKFGNYIGLCQLKEDMTWTLAGGNDGSSISALKNALDQLQDNLLSDFATSDNLLKHLPFYDSRLPFHRRVLANGLAKNIDAATNQLPSLVAYFSPERSCLIADLNNDRVVW